MATGATHIEAGAGGHGHGGHGYGGRHHWGGAHAAARVMGRGTNDNCSEHFRLYAVDRPVLSFAIVRPSGARRYEIPQPGIEVTPYVPTRQSKLP